MATNGVCENLRDCYSTTDPRSNKDLAKQLHGKNILIAGGGRGIGRTTAEFFSHCSPKSISICAIEQHEVDEVTKLCKSVDCSISTKARSIDVRDVVAVKDFVHEVVTDFGGIDILVMNAGRPPQWLPVSEGDPELWWDGVEVGIRGSYNFSRYVLPVMQKQKSGSILLTASMGAHGNAGYSSYTMAKLGMLRLAEILHVENFKQYNIKAFAVTPGAVATRMYTDFKDALEGKSKPGSYIIEGAEGEQKSVAVAMEHFGHIKQWDAPEMAAGMMTVLASGQLDFLSGRFVDSSVRIEKYLDQKDTIVQQDLYRVRMNAGQDGLIPVLKN